MHDRTVYKNEDGKWANKRTDAERAGSLHDTQEAAIAEARRMMLEDSGGELTIMGEDGKIRQKDTIGNANDPFPPKG